MADATPAAMEDHMEYYDLGPFTRKVTTTVPEAQLWFDRGLNWLYGFNHAEAIACFRRRWSTTRLRHGLLGHRLRGGAELQPALVPLRSGRQGRRPRRRL